MRPTPDRPLAIAHRSGNLLSTLREAERAGVDLVEADLWRYRGRVEVRHLKTMGPVPLLWDRWRLVSARAPRLTLSELLNAASPRTELMFDLKGHDRALPEALRAALAQRPESAEGRPYTVCSQSWELLEPFHDEPRARVVHSIGSRRMLADFMHRFDPRGVEAISIHQKLLTRERVTALLAYAPTIFAWGVNRRTRQRELAEWGVLGMISDNPALLEELAGGRSQR